MFVEREQTQCFDGLTKGKLRQLVLTVSLHAANAASGGNRLSVYPAYNTTRKHPNRGQLQIKRTGSSHFGGSGSPMHLFLFLCPM